MARRDAALFTLSLLCATLLVRLVTRVWQAPLDTTRRSLGRVLNYVSEDTLPKPKPNNGRPFLGFSSKEWRRLEHWVCSEEARRAAGGTLVSAFSGNHFKEVQLLVEDAQGSLPRNWRIVVYALSDLKADVEKTMQACCRVELRRFEWAWLGFDEARQSYEEILGRMKDLTNSVWKPIIVERAIKEVLAKENPCGYVIWGDASVRLKRKFFRPEFIPARANALGFYGRKTTSPVSKYTHPASFRMLSDIAARTIHVSPDIRDYNRTSMVCGCFSIWHPIHTSIVRNVVEPWVSCAKNITCMVPEGSEGFMTLNVKLNISHRCRVGFEGKCHRADQSIVSTLLRYHAAKEGVDVTVDHGTVNEDELETPLFPAHYTTLGMVISRGANRIPRPRLCNVTAENQQR